MALQPPYPCIDALLARAIAETAVGPRFKESLGTHARFRFRITDSVLGSDRLAPRFG